MRQSRNVCTSLATVSVAAMLASSCSGDDAATRSIEGDSSVEELADAGTSDGGHSDAGPQVEPPREPPGVPPRLPMTKEIAESCGGAADMQRCRAPDNRLHVCSRGQCVPYWCSSDGVENGKEGCGFAGPYFPFEPDRPPALSRDKGEQPVVTDGQSTLMWTGCLAGTSGVQCAQGEPLSIALQKEAVEHCGNLVWGDFDDWFLPDLFALMSIVRIGDTGLRMEGTHYTFGEIEGEAGIDPKFFEGVTLPDQLELLSSSANPDGARWEAQFSVSASSGHVRTNVLFGKGFVCTRLTQGTQPVRAPRFVPVAGETSHFDTSSRRLWIRRQYNGARYTEAAEDCASLNSSGYDDWRLPTPEEAISLFRWGREEDAGLPEPLSAESLFTAEHQDYGSFVIAQRDGRTNWAQSEVRGGYACVR